MTTNTDQSTTATTAKDDGESGTAPSSVTGAAAAAPTKKAKATLGPPPNIEPKPKLSKAERRAVQERQRAEKAARQGTTGGNATAAAATTASSSKSSGSGGSSTSTPVTSNTSQPKQGGDKKQPTGSTPQPAAKQQQLQQAKQQQAKKNDGSTTKASSTATAVVSPAAIPTDTTQNSSLVSHLPIYPDPSLLFTVGATIRSNHTSSSKSDEEPLHPFVIQNGYWYATGQIRGGNARCRAMLQCYIRLIRDFVPPIADENNKQQQQQQRDFDLRHTIDQMILKPAFQYWTEYCRPHSVSMGNAFTFLKTAVASSLERDMTWHEMSETLIDIIGAYERERINLADIAIAELACQKILFPMASYNQHQLNRRSNNRNRDGEVFLTYGNSEAIRTVFQYATKNNNVSHKFRVIVVDSRPLCEGQQMINYLRNELNIDCTYCLLSAVTYVLKDVTKVMLGAASLSSDGSVFGRVGTAVIAMAAHHQHIPVLIFSETYKISNRVFTESITSNEIGNPEDIYKIENVATSSTKKESAAATTTATSTTLQPKRLNLLYDLTPAQFVSGIITELGIVPPTSIAVLLREMNPQDIRGSG